jgi:2-hydroxychromene-2-carboxylate isomerase
MTIRWYFDFISPFAYLQWPRIQALAMHREIELRPVLLAALLDHHGQKGPAEIAAKRAFTYRHVLWKAARAGRPLRFPPAHPFNPLPALRLCIHAGATPEAVDAIFDHVWARGQRADDADALAPVADALGVDAQVAVNDGDAKSRLRDNTSEAIADGVFGVPTLVHAGSLYWGEDATDMAEAAIGGDPLFDSDAMRAVDALPVGVRRPGT